MILAEPVAERRGGGNGTAQRFATLNFDCVALPIEKPNCFNALIPRQRVSEAGSAILAAGE
jgi:hypothetical protein